ncbi:MAG TPA: DUF6366 family protein [Tetragenococcus sp.]|nr:DUF6366 family protein [Tetragenococcus sp.]
MSNKPKKHSPLVTLAENIRRSVTGNLGDPYRSNSSKDILIIILVVIVGFILFTILD